MDYSRRLGMCEKEEYKRLNEILASPKQLAFFQTYLQNICAHENLLFIEALSELKHENSLKAIETIVYRIWDTFFSNDSPLQLIVNHKEKIRLEIESYKWGILDRKDALNIFKDVENEVKAFLNQKTIEFDKSYDIDTLENPPNPYQKKVVIIGGGFTGFTVASILDPMPRFHVTLIDAKDSFEYTPGIIKLLVRPEETSSLRVRHDLYVKNGRVIIGYADQITNNAKYVHVNNEQIPFDYLVIATGSFYISKLKSFDTSSLYRVSDLTNEHLLLKKAKSVLIIGGGLVGCELANEIATHTYPPPYDFKKQITLIDSHATLIHRGSIKQQEGVLEHFNDLNIQVKLNERIIDFDSTETNSYLGSSGTRYSNYDKVFMATGTEPCSSLLQDNGDEGFESCVDHWGFLRVKPTLQLDHYKYKHIFAGGDVSNVIEEKTGYAATLAGVTIARNICRIEKGKQPIEQGTKRTLNPPLKALYGIEAIGGFSPHKLSCVQRYFSFLNPTWAALKYFNEKEFMDMVQGNMNYSSSLAIGKKPRTLYLSKHQKKQEDNHASNQICLPSINMTSPFRHPYFHSSSKVSTPDLHSRTSSNAAELHISSTNLSGIDLLSVHKPDIQHHSKHADIPDPIKSMDQQNNEYGLMSNQGLKPQPVFRSHHSNPNHER